MTCNRMEELFSAYLEGGLEIGEQHRFEAHLRSCPECADLLERMKSLTESLAGFPEVDVPPRLVERLRGIPIRRRTFRLFTDLLLRPSLQPLYAAAAGLLVLVSALAFHPDGPRIRREIDRRIHLGYAQAERLVARAGGLTGELSAYTETTFDKVKNLPVLQKDTEIP
ncbi:MAG: zf-HC2 domain-containing protein [Acidobacteriota bacterium]|nr:zf-HC2 domain-containing protein [Acidobacteriota bacterium]